MQIIYKIDILFTGIYALLILVVGIAFSAAAKNAVFIAVTLLAEVIYLFLALRRPLKR